MERGDISSIYLDNAATTKVSQEVMEAMLPYFSEVYGNPGSIHSAGRTTEKAIEAARRQVAAPIQADPDNIIFTSGGSEANTLAIIGLAEHLKHSGKTHIITSQVEHYSVLNAIKYLFDRGFSQIRYIFPWHFQNKAGSVISYYAAIMLYDGSLIFGNYLFALLLSLAVIIIIFFACINLIRRAEL